MSKLRIQGGAALRGAVSMSGSKNATQPCWAASLLTKESVEFLNVPDIADIEVMASMLRHLGVEVERRNRSSWVLCARDVSAVTLGSELTKKMRGSILIMGALVARAGEVRLAHPGGDDIGMRRVEQHLEGLRLMGAEITADGEYYEARAKSLHGAYIDLDMPTVTGTENLMMAASIAKGITVINNAAREPHVVDLSRCLIGMGARIMGAGTEQIVIVGNNGLLRGTRHTITTDYLEAGTYMVAAAATHGDVVVESMHPLDVRWLSNKLRAAGCTITEGMDYVHVIGGNLRSVDVTTWPHPGFATDLQSQYGALMTQAEGTSTVSEAVFEHRFQHIEELRRLGADVRIEGRSAIIIGVTTLHGTKVTAPDIRGGAALVIAALCAEGITEVDGGYHLDRGYQDLSLKLRALGADIERIDDDHAGTDSYDLRNVVGD